MEEYKMNHSNAMLKNIEYFARACACGALYRCFLRFFMSLFLRSGAVVVALPANGAAVEPYLILTLWPKTVKPKPATAEVPLDAVKCFRAAKLMLDPANEAMLKASFHMEMLAAHNVLAVLDAASASVHQGEVRITAESMEMLRKMQGAEFQPPKMPVKMRGAVRVKKPAQPSLKKAGTAVKKMLKKNKKEKKASEKPSATHAAKKPKKDAVVLDDQHICAEDLRRSEKGRASIALAVKRLRNMDNMLFSDPVFDKNTHLCCLSGLEDVTWKGFCPKVAKFFESKYAFSARTPAAYGEKVLQDLMSIEKGFKADSADRNRWIDMIRAVCKIMKCTGIAA